MSKYTISYFKFNTVEGRVAVHTWLPDCEICAVKGVIQIVHSMGEHVKCYEHLAEYFNQFGYIFAGEDHAGHGESIMSDEHTWYFAEEEGWNKILLDTFELHKKLKQMYGNKKYILYGHSVGSLIARACASRYPGEFSAFIFSGISEKSLAIPLVKFIVKMEIRRKGLMAHSRLVDRLVDGVYGKYEASHKTRYDCLSEASEKSDSLIENQSCGFRLRCASYRDLLDGMEEVSRNDWARKVPNVPIYLLAGACGSVGDNGKGVRKVCNKLIKSGKTHVALQIYKDDRNNENKLDEEIKGIAAFLRGVQLN